MIRYRDDITGRQVWIHAADRRREDQSPGAEGPHDPHGEHDVLHRIALIEVHPPLHGDDGHPGERAEQEGSFMEPGDGGDGKIWNLLVGYLRRHLYR